MTNITSRFAKAASRLLVGSVISLTAIMHSSLGNQGAVLGIPPANTAQTQEKGYSMSFPASTYAQNGKMDFPTFQGLRVVFSLAAARAYSQPHSPSKTQVINYLNDTIDHNPDLKIAGTQQLAKRYFASVINSANEKDLQNLLKDIKGKIPKGIVNTLQKGGELKKDQIKEIVGSATQTLPSAIDHHIIKSPTFY